MDKIDDEIEILVDEIQNIPNNKINNKIVEDNINNDNDKDNINIDNNQKLNDETNNDKDKEINCDIEKVDVKEKEEITVKKENNLMSPRRDSTEDSTRTRSSSFRSLMHVISLKDIFGMNKDSSDDKKEKTVEETINNNNDNNNTNEESKSEGNGVELRDLQKKPSKKRLSRRKSKDKLKDNSISKDKKEKRTMKGLLSPRGSKNEKEIEEGNDSTKIHTKSVDFNDNNENELKKRNGSDTRKSTDSSPLNSRRVVSNEPKVGLNQSIRLLSKSESLLRSGSYEIKRMRSKDDSESENVDSNNNNEDNNNDNNENDNNDNDNDTNDTNDNDDSSNFDWGSSRSVWEQEIRNSKSNEDYELENTAILKEVKEIMKSMKDVLDLRNYYINANDCKYICNAIANETIEKLILNTYSIGDDGIYHIINLLRTNSYIRYLKLCGWPPEEDRKDENIQMKKISDIAIENLANQLKYCQIQLQSLDLSNNYITDNGAKYIASAIHLNSSLQSLKLNGNPLGNESARLLAKSLLQNHSLTSLKLLDTKCTPTGGVYIFDSLLYNRTLRVLHLRVKSNFSSKQLTRITNCIILNNSLISARLLCGNSELSVGQRKGIDKALFNNFEFMTSRSLKKNATSNLDYENTVNRIRVTFLSDDSSSNSNNSNLSSSNSSSAPKKQQKIEEIIRVDFTNYKLIKLKWEVTWNNLTEIILNNNRLKKIPPHIGILKNLVILQVQNNQLLSLPNEIGSCNSLQVIQANYNQITELPETIYHIVHLQTLSIHHNRITTISNQINSMFRLKYLNISFNNIQQLPDDFAPSLVEFYIENNQLTSLPISIGNMKDLKILAISNNNLNYLPLEITKLKLNELDYTGNPFSSIPRTILTGGINSIYSYLKELENGSEVFSVVRLIVVGQKGSGKANLISSLTNKENILNLSASKRLISRKKKKEINEGFNVVVQDWNFEDITFRTWNFTGLDDIVVCSTHRFFATSNSIYIITFNISTDSTNDLDNWIQAVAGQITNPVFVIGTFADKVIDKNFTILLLDKLRSKYQDKFPNIVAYCAVSNKSRKGIKELKSQISSIARNKGMVGQRFSSTYILFINQLETIKQKLEIAGTPTLTWTKFNSIAAKLSLQNIEEVAQFLHKIGVIFYYNNDTKLKDFVFLDPKWLIGIYNQLYNIKEETIPDGILKHKDLSLAWSNIPQPIFETLLTLLEKFDISYRLPHSNLHKEMSSIIPTFLPNDRPQEVKQECWQHLIMNENTRDIVRIWEFKYLPKSFFYKLMTRIFHFPSIMVSSVWSNGMVIKQENNKALFEYTPSVYRLKVTIRTTYESAVSNTFPVLLFDTINNYVQGWFKNQLTNVLLPCIHCLKERSFDPFLFSISDCELCAARGKRYVHCRGIRPVRTDLIAPDIAMADIEHLERSEIILKNELGEGSFAKVYRAEYQNNEVAVKIIKINNEEEEGEGSVNALLERFAEFRREVSLMSGLDHENLVELKGLCLDQDTMYMVTEFLAFGDLYNFLHNPSNELDWDLRIKIAIDVASGMNFLHTTTPPIIHRDLKTPNILMASNLSFSPVVAKVADFGLSSTLVQNVKGRDVFNPTWLAPEVMVRNAEYTEKADIYSFGIILWELLTRENPFDEFKFPFSSQLEDAIINQNLRPTIGEDTPSAYRKLMESCWHNDPKLRPTFIQILQILQTEIQPLFAPSLSQNFDTLIDNISFNINNDESTDSSPHSSPNISLENNSLGDLKLKNNILPYDNNDLQSPTRGRRRGSVANHDPAKMKALLRNLTGSKFAESDDTLIRQENIKYVATTLFPEHKGSVKCMLVVHDKVWVGCGDGSISIWTIQVLFLPSFLLLIFINNFICCYL